MDNKEKRSLGVYLIALSVILANLAILSVIYEVPFLSSLPAIRKALPFLSMAANYPFDLFQIYLKEDIIVHFYWILLVMISSFGLLLFNQFSRTVFIVFNIIHFVLLGVITVFHFGHEVFWGYFFKWYFNMVAFLLYAGYLTLPEIRDQFKTPTKEIRFDLWFLKFRRKILGAKDAEGYFNLGLAYRKLGRVEEAVSFLTRAVQIVPGNAEYHFRLGQISLEKKNYGDAVNSFKEAVRLDPLHGQARYLLGIAYEKSGCIEESVQSFRRASFLEARKSEVFRHLGTACFRAGYWDEAEQALEKAAELDPTDHLCYYSMGLIMLKDEKRVKEAEELFKRALRLKPDFSDGYKELGNVYVQLGDYKGAVRAFHDVLRLEPDQKQAHYQLGFAYVMLQDMASARREYNFLKEIDPDLAQTLALLLR